MLVIEKHFSKKILLLSIISFISSCNKSYEYDLNAGDAKQIPRINKSIGECIESHSKDTNEPEDTEIQKIKSFLPNAIAAQERQLTYQTLKKYFSREANDLEAVSDLLLNLEEIIQKYDPSYKEENNNKLEKISDFIKKTSDEYLAEIKRITQENYLSMVSYKKMPAFGALQNNNFSIEKFLITLKATTIARKFQISLEKIKSIYTLGENYVPLPDSINSKKLKFIHVKTGEHKLVEIENDEDFKNLHNFKNYFNQNLNKLSPYVKADKSGILSLYELDTPHGLSAGLGIKILLNHFTNTTRNNLIDEETPDTELSKILKIHAFANLIQIGVDNLSEANKILFIFQSLNKNMIGKNTQFFNAIGKIDSKINLGLNGANVILDALELAKANDAKQKIQFGTQLTFDSTGLGIGVGSTVLSLVGASSASSALSIFCPQHSCDSICWPRSWV